MKEHSNDFKTQIKELGRKLRSQVTYGNTVLEEELYAVTPHYKGNILKSTMKQLDIETTENIPIMTQVNYKLGMLVEGDYEWLDFGNYIVYSSEKQEDKDTYKLVCYDKLIYSMIPYSGVDGDFPMTLREYLNAICTKLGLTFGSNTETFANYDREILSDRYLGLEEYTYRDVLDEIAQATGSMICLNSDDEVVVKYINEGEENYNTIEGTNLVITDADTTKQEQITEIKGNGTNSSLNLVPIDRMGYFSTQQCTIEYVIDSTLGKTVLHITSDTNSYPTVRYEMNRLEKGKYYALRFNYKLTVQNDPR